MEESVTVRASISAARCGFFILWAVSLLLGSSSLFADSYYNNSDFAAFADKWLQTGCSSANNWCGGYDYDISGKVDAKDLYLFSENWLTSKDHVLSDNIAAWILHTGVPATWNYDNGFILLSLYEKYQRCHNPTYLKFIKDWVDSRVSSSGVISGYSKTNYILDHIQPGNLCLAMYKQFGTAKYKTAANTLISQLAVNAQPITTDGGFWHKNTYKYQMWLDGIYMAEPFAVQYAQMFNAPSWYNVAGFQITLIATHTQDTATGLYYHGWADLYGMAHASPVVTPPVWASPEGHSPEFWGRAMGWYAMAIVDCLDTMPADDPCCPKMITILNDLAAGLAYYQDPCTGMWWQIVNKGYPRATYPTNYTESSCTAMFSYALGKAVEKGYIPSDPYLAVSRAGFEGLVDNKVSFDNLNWLVFIDTVKVGSLSGAGNYTYYLDSLQCPRVTNDVKGVGALMRAALQYEKSVTSP